MPSVLPSALCRNPEDTLTMAAQPALDKVQRHKEQVSPKLLPLLDHLERHLFDPTLNVIRWKQACGIRDNSIAIQFHKEMGITPKAFISQLRLETATRLLLHSELRVWQIAHLIGYSSLGVFSKAFNRWAGQRPNAYRRQMRAIDGQNMPSQWLHADFLKRALAGELEPEEAQALLLELRKLYPTPPPEADTHDEETPQRLCC